MKDYFDLQNEKFFDFLEDTFNIKKSKNWEDIAKSITIVKMKRTYRVFAELYPRKFDYLNELKKAHTDFSTLHWGNLRGSNIIQDVSRFSLYSEKIIVFHPLQNPAVTNPNIDPGRNPKKWIPDFLEALYFYIVIQKWVRSGIVKIIINPIDYDFELGNNFFKMTTDRINSVGTGKLFAEQKDETTDAMAYQFAHAFKGSKEKVIADLLALGNPILEHEEATDLAERMINQREFLNPLYNNLNIPMTGGMIFSSKGGGSMEAIQMLAEATGSSIFTPDKGNWGQLKRLDNLDFSLYCKVVSNVKLNLN
ncbi:MAG: hypothetical protein EOO92_19555 [Pedobacter sp.]|nr:MAG: hypothetical protein EOO92_19555 [Pedobacter sp.]